jgi:glycosyltransferase involved in cell wall biosynthesis
VEQPLPLVASLDVVVHAAIEPEPFGRVVLEAMALGRPVIATALGGPVEIIQDGISGFLVPPRTRRLSRSVYAGFSMIPPCSRIRAGALRRAEEFSVEAYARQIGIVYDDALIASGKDPSFSKAAS